MEFQHISNAGGTLSLNTDTYPLHDVDTHCEMSDRPTVPKMQAAGQWGVFTYSQKRIWHVEGDIMAQTMAGYDAARKVMLNNILPAATTNNRYTGTVKVSDETGEEFISQVSLITYSLPVEGLYPSRGSYMFEWESDDPFVYKVSDGLPIYI